MTFGQAREIMSRILNSDEGLRLGYRANIAMRIYDNYVNCKKLDILKFCNQTADDIIDLIWKDDNEHNKNVEELFATSDRIEALKQSKSKSRRDLI